MSDDDDRTLLEHLLAVAAHGASLVGQTIFTDTDDWNPLMLIVDGDDAVSIITLPGEMLQDDVGKDLLAMTFVPIAQGAQAKAMCFVSSTLTKITGGPTSEAVTLLAATRDLMALQLGRTTRTPTGATLEWEEPMFLDEEHYFEGRFPAAMKVALSA